MTTTNQEDASGAVAPGTIIDGRYKIVRCIGQGGNGLVYEVEHTRTGRHLALKSLLDESGQGRLGQEARATSLLTNPHASRITDMGQAKPIGTYLVMDLLEGQSLRALLDDAGQLPVELVVNMALQVCECLAEAHGHNIIHRDLKPENVFLCASPWPGQRDVRVLDFGVVKIGEEGPIPNASLTRTGSTVGTPYYMSLEQLRNSSAVDARADIYALGVVIYESLAGKKPFQADTIGDLVYALCSGPPTNIARLRPDAPAAFSEVVMRMLAMKKEDRPASMTEVGLALLPHGNPAFGLWLRVDGKQPALAAAKGRDPGASEPPTAAAKAPLRVGARAPQPPSAPKPVKELSAKTSQLPAQPAETPSIGVARPIGDASSASTLPQVPVPKIGDAKPVLWTDASLEGGPTEKRRDTPTEMYKQDAHGELELASSSSGDRDTPTRAIPAASLLEESARRQASSTLALKIPGDEPTGDLPAAPAGMGAFGGAGGSKVPKSTMPLGDVGMLAGLPALDQAAGRSAPGDAAQRPSVVGLAPVMAPQALDFPASQASLSDAFKPAWQRSLDQTLVSVGRNVEIWIAKYKAAPKNTQTLVLVCAGSVALFFLVLIAFIFFH